MGRRRTGEFAVSADRRPETPWRIVNPSSADGFSIVKKAYSEAPWRIVNQYGAEVAFEFEITDPLTGRVHLMAIGYRTKNEAVKALGRLTAKLWERLERKGW